MNKKVLVLLIFSIFLINILPFEVQAQSQDGSNAIKNAMSMFTSVFEGTFGTL